MPDSENHLEKREEEWRRIKCPEPVSSERRWERERERVVLPVPGGPVRRMRRLREIIEGSVFRWERRRVLRR